jgi:LmbE family N-acetylglucosaminyl deacetylase
MSKTKYNLICVAHPDDETLFFGGLIQRKRNGLPWTVVCLTSDGSLKRKNQFLKACSLLKVSEPLWWGYPDRYEERLPVIEIRDRLLKLPSPKEIYTHGIIGEYGHPHHQDCSWAIHAAFSKTHKVYACAYNSYPELRLHLTEKEFKLKAQILIKIYGSETNRFLNLLPATSEEGFLRLDLSEVNGIYRFLSEPSRKLNFELKNYSWLKPYLNRLKELKRPF